MPNGIIPIPPPVNDPVRDYAPGSPETAPLKAKLAEMLAEEIEIPLVIGGKEVRTGDTQKAVCPHDHNHVLGVYHKAGEAEIQQAVEASQKAWREWSEVRWEERAAVMLKAADSPISPRRAAAPNPRTPLIWLFHPEPDSWRSK